MNTSTISSTTKNLVLTNNSTISDISAETCVNKKVTSASVLGGSILTTSTRRREATRTSDNLNNHGTSQEYSLAQLNGEGKPAAMGTGYGATKQGD